jgi:hypothetical protein
MTEAMIGPRLPVRRQAAVVTGIIARTAHIESFVLAPFFWLGNTPIVLVLSARSPLPAVRGSCSRLTNRSMASTHRPSACAGYPGTGRCKNPTRALGGEVGSRIEPLPAQAWELGRSLVPDSPHEPSH